MKTTPIIQGGMGVGVSNWRLAAAVARTGQTGVVSGTALDVVMARRLQLGDVGGHVRRALSRFPFPDVAQRVLDRWFVAGGKPVDAPFRPTPMATLRPDRRATDLTVCANFTEVFLAREGARAGGGTDAAAGGAAEAGQIGVNYLEKIQLPTLPALYGALLGGVSCVLMGAGIPRAIPGVLDLLARGDEARLPVHVHGAAPGQRFETSFDPREFCGAAPPALERPAFLPIVSLATLAEILMRKPTGRIDGFIVEGPTAGGHNAPPRGELRLSASGEPVYGERDAVDLEAFRRLGVPFWLAGSQATPARLAEAIAVGAAGIQVGTAFAFCDESGIADALKRRVLGEVRAGTVHMRTDPRASPTGFPFKVVEIAGTAGDRRVTRERACDLGYLRQAHVAPDGTLVWRCPAEPEADFLRKGGAPEEMKDRLCVCNGLVATVGLGQIRKDGRVEPALVTSGDEIVDLTRFSRPGAQSYAAADVVATLLSPGPTM